MGCCWVLDEIIRVSVDLRLEKARECLNDAELLLSSESYASSANAKVFLTAVEDYIATL